MSTQETTDVGLHTNTEEDKDGVKLNMPPKILTPIVKSIENRVLNNDSDYIIEEISSMQFTTIYSQNTLDFGKEDELTTIDDISTDYNSTSTDKSVFGGFDSRNTTFKNPEIFLNESFYPTEAFTPVQGVSIKLKMCCWTFFV